MKDDDVKIILDTLKACEGNYEKTAKRLMVSIALVEETDIIHNRKYNYTDAGRGKPHLQRYIIAVRNVKDPQGWDNNDPKIKKARELYDEGLVEISTGRDGMNLILYAIPREYKDEKIKKWLTEEEIA